MLVPASAGRAPSDWQPRAREWGGADLDQQSAHETITGLSGAEDHFAVGLDVTDVAVVQKAVAATVDRFGGLDVLINVAGGDTAHPEFEDTDDETWLGMINLNLLGVVRCCRAAIPHLRRSTEGPAIVTIGSINALMALGSEPYSSAKAGLGALTLNLAAQLGPSGIRVNLIAPGTIRTPVWDGQPGGADRYAGSYPLQRVGEPGCGCRGRISCFFRCSADNRPNSGRRRRPALDL